MDAQLTVRNVLGRAEQYNMQVELGHQKSNTFRLSAAKPRALGLDLTLRAEADALTDASHLKHSSFVEKARAGRLSARLGHPSAPGGCHEVACEGALREVGKLPMRTASWPILKERGAILNRTFLEPSSNLPRTFLEPSSRSAARTPRRRSSIRSRVPLSTMRSRRRAARSSRL